MKQNIVRLKDIADKVGVSTNTVSRALKDAKDISTNLKIKIKRIANEMGYIPNNISDYMRGNKTDLVGIVIGSLTNPFYTISTNKLLQRLQDKGFLPLIMVSNNNHFDFDLFTKLMINRVCGIVSFCKVDDNVASFCVEKQIPLVMVGISIINPKVSSVNINDFSFGKKIGEECLKSNAKRPCYIGSKDMDISIFRYNGFVETIGVKYALIDDYHCEFKNRDQVREEIAHDIVSNGNDFIFCFNDEIASFIIEVLEEINYKDYQIYGVDAISRCLPICRKINSVGYHYGELIEAALDILIEQVSDYENAKIRHVLFDPIVFTY